MSTTDPFPSRIDPPSLARPNRGPRIVSGLPEDRTGASSGLSPSIPGLDRSYPPHPKGSLKERKRKSRKKNAKNAVAFRSATEQASLASTCSASKRTADRRRRDRVPFGGLEEQHKVQVRARNEGSERIAGRTRPRSDTNVLRPCCACFGPGSTSRSARGATTVLPGVSERQQNKRCAVRSTMASYHVQARVLQRANHLSRAELEKKNNPNEALGQRTKD